jgi:uncharacterized protein YwgA
MMKELLEHLKKTRKSNREHIEALTHLRYVEYDEEKISCINDIKAALEYANNEIYRAIVFVDKYTEIARKK